MRDERWRAVPGFEGLYEVSDQGRVHSLPRMVRGRYGPRRQKDRAAEPVEG